MGKYKNKKPKAQEKISRSFEDIRRAMHGDSDNEDSDYEAPSFYQSDEDEIFNRSRVRSSSPSSITSINSSGSMTSSVTTSSTPSMQNALNVMDIIAKQMGVQISQKEKPQINTQKLDKKRVADLQNKLKSYDKKQPIKAGKLDKSHQAILEAKLYKQKLSTNENLKQSSAIMEAFFAKKVAPAALIIEEAGVKAVNAAGKITDEALHDTSLPASKLSKMASDAIEAAAIVEDKTNKFEKLITDHFDKLDQPQMLAATQLIELGDAIVKAAEEKAHAARAAVARNEAIEASRLAISKAKYLEAQSIKNVAMAKAQNYAPSTFNMAEERYRADIERARAELRAAHEEAKAREIELKRADHDAKAAAQRANDIAKKNFNAAFGI